LPGKKEDLAIATGRNYSLTAWSHHPSGRDKKQCILQFPVTCPKQYKLQTHLNTFAPNRTARREKLTMLNMLPLRRLEIFYTHRKLMVNVLV